MGVATIWGRGAICSVVPHTALHLRDAASAAPLLVMAYPVLVAVQTNASDQLNLSAQMSTGLLMCALWLVLQPVASQVCVLLLLMKGYGTSRNTSCPIANLPKSHWHSTSTNQGYTIATVNHGNLVEGDTNGN